MLYNKIMRIRILCGQAQLIGRSETAEKNYKISILSNSYVICGILSYLFPPFYSTILLKMCTRIVSVFVHTIYCFPVDFATLRRRKNLTDKQKEKCVKFACICWFIVNYTILSEEREVEKNCIFSKTICLYIYVNVFVCL